MPNWKTYESSVRLLSAIIAAHPQLKLNYDEVARFYGGGTKYKSVWYRMTQINKHAKLLAAAVEQGNDPHAVELNDGPQGKPRAQDISRSFGGGCTTSAIENRFRRLKSDAKLINDALKKGIDPITLNIGDTQGEVALKSGGCDIARCYGSEATKSSLMNVFKRSVNPNVKSILTKLEVSGDPKDIVLRGLAGRGNGQISKLYFLIFTQNYSTTEHHTIPNPVTGQLIPILTLVPDMAKFYGFGANAKAMQNVFSRNIKPDVKKLSDALAAGRKPQDILFSEFTWGKGTHSKHFGSDATSGGLSKYFSRNIMPNAKLIRECVQAGNDPKDVLFQQGEIKSKNASKNGGNEIAKHFGSDTSPGALQIHFFRQVKPDVKRLQECVKAGGDPKDLNIAGREAKDRAYGKEMAACFGSDATVAGIKFQFATNFKQNAKRIQAAHAAGKDCKDLGIGESGTVVGKAAKGDKGQSFVFLFALQALFLYLSGPLIEHATEVACIMGSDVTKKAVECQISQSIKFIGKRQLEMLASSQDPKDIDLGSVKAVWDNPRGPWEIVNIMGDDVTSKAISWQISQVIRPIGRRMIAMRAAGEDPATIDLGKPTKGGNDISNYFGSDSTPGGIGFQFRAIKADAKRQRDCFHAGGDPKNLTIGGGKAMAHLLNDGTTISALDHRFRPLKKAAQEMVAATAKEYGEGITAENGGTPAKAKKPRATPAKRSAKGKKMKNSDDDDGEEMGENDSDVEETPSKKQKTAAINKTKGGRVAKSVGGGRAGKVNYANPASDDDEDAGGIIKAEDGGDSQVFSSNGASFSNGHGNGNGYRNGSGVHYNNGYYNAADSFEDAETYDAGEDPYVNAEEA
ncbi:hypothetical protein G7Y89_g15477 [Cudoniella acicularis]|uniref:Uncharacterized protein n=1 Tax=Cudoniella acicularis TaxID=354080 RepID=A0A8H4VMD7_9HELO|nr:hypothetical protein G7Y89_g15477 [Cudoniella acicularis]